MAIRANKRTHASLSLTQQSHYCHRLYDRWYIRILWFWARLNDKRRGSALVTSPSTRGSTPLLHVVQVHDDLLFNKTLRITERLLMFLELRHKKMSIAWTMYTGRNRTSDAWINHYTSAPQWRTMIQIRMKNRRRLLECHAHRGTLGNVGWHMHICLASKQYNASDLSVWLTHKRNSIPKNGCAVKVMDICECQTPCFAIHFYGRDGKTVLKHRA